MERDNSGHRDQSAVPGESGRGLYSEWSFRDTPAGVRERYFKRRKNGQFEISPHIRKRVTFSYLNLAEDAYPAYQRPQRDGRDLLPQCADVFQSGMGKEDWTELPSITGQWRMAHPKSGRSGSNSFPQFKQTPFPEAVLYQEKPAGLRGPKAWIPRSRSTVLRERSMPILFPIALCMPEAAAKKTCYNQKNVQAMLEVIRRTMKRLMRSAA